MLSIQSAYDNLVREKEEVEAKLARAEEEAGRKIAQAEERAEAYAQEVEGKAKAAVASETTRIQAEFDRRLEAELEKAKGEAVLAYRRDRGRAVEQTTAFIEGGCTSLGRSRMPSPVRTGVSSRFPPSPMTLWRMSTPLSFMRLRRRLLVHPFSGRGPPVWVYWPDSLCMGVGGTGRMVDRIAYAWGSLVPASWLTKVLTWGSLVPATCLIGFTYAWGLLVPASWLTKVLTWGGRWYRPHV
ncbi:hypothetical protein M0R45_006939 [Rubus argutus]|uniref:Uncharacterized protein n=1 Tax=Rubus argutus TaxID=59490 RepID=A0AAW1YRX9_RUBAR